LGRAGKALQMKGNAAEGKHHPNVLPGPMKNIHWTVAVMRRAVVTEIFILDI